MSLKISQVQQIESADWGKLVSSVYKRTYCLQQQDGCMIRGIIHLQVPDKDNDHKMNDIIPEIVNHPTMGVKFNVWLERDPEQLLENDLHSKGLLPAGKYQINIEW